MHKDLISDVAKHVGSKKRTKPPTLIPSKAKYLRSVNLKKTTYTMTWSSKPAKDA